MTETIDAPLRPIMDRAKVVFFGAGCFWGAEEYYALMPGVLHTDVGYANGNTPHPSYERVCSGRTNAVETVRVYYDPEILSVEQLFTGLFRIIDPTTLNRQGGDIGTQYRTGIYYLDEETKEAAEAFIKRQQTRYDRPIVVEVEPCDSYYLAEQYHQRYLRKNPGGYCHIPTRHFVDVRENGAPQEDVSSLSASRYRKPNDKRIKERISPLAWRVTQENATEGPFSYEFYKGNPCHGLYVDVVTGEPLFLTRDQFNAGCGWPSFTRPVDPSVLTTHDDTSFGMFRTEVRSRVGDSHLGHVFADGPVDHGGLRYCINGAALRFVPKDEMEAQGYGDLLPLFDE